MWEMKCESLAALAQRLLEYDRIITERLLHQVWAPPPVPAPALVAPDVDVTTEGGQTADAQQHQQQHQHSSQQVSPALRARLHDPELQALLRLLVQAGGFLVEDGLEVAGDASAAAASGAAAAAQQHTEAQGPGCAPAYVEPEVPPVAQGCGEEQQETAAGGQGGAGVAALDGSSSSSAASASGASPQAASSPAAGLAAAMQAPADADDEERLGRGAEQLQQRAARVLAALRVTTLAAFEAVQRALGGGDPASTALCPPQEVVRRLTLLLAPGIPGSADAGGKRVGSAASLSLRAPSAGVAHLSRADVERGYFDSLAGVVSEERHQVWQLLLEGMRRYQAGLQAEHELEQQVRPRHPAVGPYYLVQWVGELML